MSTATISELGANLRSLLAAVQVGDTIAIVENGEEIARIVPPSKTKNIATGTANLDSWSRQRLADLEAVFPEPVIGAIDELEGFRADRF